MILVVCIFCLIAQPSECGWLSKTWKKLENSAKKRIAEGIAIAIRGGPRYRRHIGDAIYGDILATEDDPTELEIPDFTDIEI
ncbi:unnamed protein product [Anisakis simplex]|uniref:Cecropin-P2 n=1 Tax=Anisakis simplex TaxID=6269 RepID=A0A0M3JRF3_ANISI|nr:unnamed protein product [Anisakis simplex]